MTPRALILAAGRGSRMGNLTDSVPKCLTPLAGRPLLAWQLDALRGAGIETIGVVRGYRAELLDEWGLVTFDNRHWASTNMVASLACAASWLREAPVIVSYSDIFYPASVVRALLRLPAPADIAITYDPGWLALWSERFDDPLTDAETFRLDGSRVIEIGGRASALADIRGQYMGLLKFTPPGWAAAEAFLATLSGQQRDCLDMTKLLSGVIAAGGHVESTAVSGTWGEVDSARDLALYERLIAEGRMVIP